MARWLVRAFVLLQVALFALAEEATSPGPSSTESELTTVNVSTSTDKPTRPPIKPSAMPDLVHNAPNTTVSNVLTSNDTKSNNNEKKNDAFAIHSCNHVLVISTLGLLLTRGAI